MNKLDSVLRDKVIVLISQYLAEGWSDFRTSDFADIIAGGYKGLVDLTDQELYDEFNNYFDDPEEGTEAFDLKAEMDAQIAIDTMLRVNS